MQLMQLYNDDESIYYYVKDTTREYKEFNFGSFTQNKEHDKGTVNIVNRISMSCTQYPYISSKKSKKLFTTIVGTNNQGSWYDAANEYRDFLISSNMDRQYSKYVSEWNGFMNDTIAQFGDNIKKTYNSSISSDKIIASQDHLNVDTIVLFGWHKGGFDSNYPDYEFFEGDGFGKEEFKKLVDRAHANDDKIIPYLNAHITAMNSNWGQKVIDSQTGLTNMYNSAIKKSGFDSKIEINNYTNYMYYESYGTTTGYYATCPYSEEYVSQISKVVDQLASCGIDGLWMDQMMEMPALLCFDENHGHKTPATAYGEGYKKLYSSIDSIFKKYNIDYLIFAEGVTDAWIEYIDICSYMWGRKLYAQDNVNPGDKEYMHPEITAYTMPCSFVGIEGYNVKYSKAYGFLFGSPLLFGLENLDKKVTDIYQENGDIYYYGRYMHEQGITYSNKGVDKIQASIIVGNSNRIGIQVYNNSNDNLGTTISINLEELGIDKNIISAIDLVTNEAVEVFYNKIIVNVSKNDLTAIALILED